ncbi:MAG TPA: DUF4349 domain-containing protein [Thermoleophilaceae bacterium]
MTALSHELEIALRAETPRPSAAFAERLDRRVAEGFPRARKSWITPRRALPLLAGAAAAIVAVTVIALPSGGGSRHTTAAPGAASGSAKLVAPDVAGAGSSTTAAGPSLSAQTAPAAPIRRVERSAELTLGAPSSKLETVANEVVSVTDRHHGFVLHSTVTTGRGGAATGGEFVLQVPSATLQSTLSDLSGLADVRSRTQNSDDITSSYNSVSAQLEEARALRHSLLARLAQATTDTEAQALRKRIRLESAQIRSLSARFSQLQNRARFATVDVTLQREPAHHSAGAGGVSGDFHDALHSLAVSFGIALRVLGVALPLALLAALGWLAAALLRRRRRETALS